jgi:hypothetical protein
MLSRLCNGLTAQVCIRGAGDYLKTVSAAESAKATNLLTQERVTHESECVLVIITRDGGACAYLGAVSQPGCQSPGVSWICASPRGLGARRPSEDGC